jgi:flavin reductase (DIM6/NTAB) family NADH-FMN oxidoreductase RutF
VEWSAGATGAPVLAGTIATLDCRKYQTIDAGDHFILIGEVVSAAMADGDPLLYYASRYRRLG